MPLPNPRRLKTLFNNGKSKPVVTLALRSEFVIRHCVTWVLVTTAHRVLGGVNGIQAGRVKAIPTLAWTGPEGSRRCLLLLLLRARLLKLQKHLGLKAYCAYPKLSSAQIQYPCVSYKETEVPE
jgi:hypothetical protein